VATSGPRCLYCGALLPQAPAIPAGDAAADTALPGPARALLVLDLSGAEPARLARALELSPFEAAQLARRGGFHLHRVADEAVVGSEEMRLREAGLPVTVVPESEARVAPVLALRGRYQAGELQVRHAGGELRLGARDVLMVVQGPITREYQPAREVKRPRSATLEPGYRMHLHRSRDPRALELDPGAFAFGGDARPGSSLLTLSAWVRELAAGAPTDDHFRRLPPALGAAAPEADGSLGAAAGLAGPGGRDKDAPLILDNLAQFRFYSGWRAAVERRRRG
jgi:hypothetical protein